MRRYPFLLAIVIVAISGGAPVSGQEPADRDSHEIAAARVQGATATIRIYCTSKIKEGDGPAAEKPADKPAEKPAENSAKRKSDQLKSQERSRGAAATAGQADNDCQRPCSVIVCTGVCVAANKIVAAVPVSSDSKIRLTFPGGNQDDARLRVVDEFSGLVLLDSPNCAAKPLEMADALPAAGSTVITAAAWGVEKPLVFRGMVSGTGHTLAGICYPPLVVCQLPTTDTSSGAAVVDRQGKLLGIVVGSDPAQAHQSWMTYAVPVSHVQRLLRACEESDKRGNRDTVIVLKRRRPMVGWKLESEADEIVVRWITADGPAAKAGVEKGDCVLEVDGIRIRSIYQAWAPTMCKQAGDTLTYRVRRGEKTHDVVVVLGGAVEMESLPADKLSEIVQPKLEFGRDESGKYYFKPFQSRSASGADRQSADSEQLGQLEAENRRLKAELQRLERKSGARNE